MLIKCLDSKKMECIVFRKILGVCIITILSCLLYSVADNKILPGAYADFNELKKSLFSYVFTPSFKEKYAFINVDDNTYEALGNPDFTPPELITRLVKLADKSNPKLLIIDIDLRPSIENNQELIDYLKNHKSFPILLTDTPSKVTNIISWREQHLLDDIIKSNKNLFWVSTLYYPQSDGIIRQSPFFDLFCSNNEVIIRPSVALTVRALKDFDILQTNKLLASANIMFPLDRITEEKSCDSISLNHSFIQYKQPETGEDVKINFNNQSFDIQYSFIKDGHNVDNKNNLVVVENSAKGLISEVNISDISTDSFNERIIIIGGTNFESKDIHETPIGSQHGVYLILNAVESALNIKNPYTSQQAKSYLTLLFFAVPIGIAAVIFRNTALVIISLLLLFIIPRIFNNSYTVEFFSVLTVIFIIEIVIEIYELGKRLWGDLKKYEYRFALASEFRKTPPRRKLVKSFKRDSKIINRMIQYDKRK